jgi:tryptophan-rich sensory protein
VNNKAILVISITICQFVGIVGSIFTASSLTSWYATLAKPNFSPPGWIFAPMWVTLYLLMGISLYLIWTNKTKNNRKSFIAFGVQLFLNGLWSLLFFGLKSPLYGLIDILLLIAAITFTILFSYRISVLAGVLLIPYLAWVCFAAVLNYSIFLLN